MASFHFCKNTVNGIGIQVTVAMGVVDYGKLSLSTHIGNSFSNKPASPIIKNMMIMFEKSNPALSGFLASRNIL